MNKYWFQFSIWLFFTLCAHPFAPLFAGNEDDIGGGDAGGTIYPFYGVVPLMFFDGDYSGKRFTIQQPTKNMPPMARVPLVIPPPLADPPVIIPPLAQKPLQVPALYNQQDGLDGEFYPAWKNNENTEDDLTHDEMSDDDHGPSSHGSHSSTSDMGSSDSVDARGIPLVIGEGDADQGRATIQEDGNGGRTFPHRLLNPRIDEKYGRTVITLEGGSPDNPYQVCDRTMFYVGALIGVGFVEPHSWVQFNAISKWKYTRSKATFRSFDNYDDAIRVKKLKYPEKVEDFDTWKSADWLRRNGMVSLSASLGISYFLPDVRAGALGEYEVSARFEKDGKLIRVSLTYEVNIGAIARAQIVPLQKAEAKDQGVYENTRVYVYDLTKDNERNDLDDLVRRNILRTRNAADKDVKDGDATLLTTRIIKRHKSTFTPLQVGFPIIVRAHKTWKIDRYQTKITTKSGIDYKFRAKAHYVNTTFRNLNFKKFRGSHKGKSRRHFTHHHREYNRGFQGGVVKPPRFKGDDHKLQMVVKSDGSFHYVERKRTDEEMQRFRNQRYIQVQYHYFNDRVDAKTVNSYVKKFNKKVGVNHYMVDSGYRSNAEIGDATVRWDLRVGPNAIDYITKNIVESDNYKHFFKPTANELINEYFAKRTDGFKNDPHKICRSRVKHTEACIWLVRHKTQRTLVSLAKKLKRLEKESIVKSSSKTTEILADIAKDLGTNQFVLQAFLFELPPNLDGYGRLQVFGERILARRFNTDPGKKMREVGTSSWSDVPVSLKQDDENPEVYGEDDNVHYADVDEEVLGFDWDQINGKENLHNL